MRNLAVTLVVALSASQAWAQFGLGDPSLGYNSPALDHSMLDRSLVLEQGFVEAEARFQHVSMNFGYGRSSATGLIVGAAFGIGGVAEAGVSTGLLIDPEFQSNEQLALTGMAEVFASETMDVGVSLSLPLHFGDGDTLPALFVGVPLRLKLTDQFAIMTGHNLVSIISALDGVLLNINLALAFQPTEMFALRVDTWVLSLLIGDNSDVVSFADAFMLGLSVVIAPIEMLDIHVGLTFPDMAFAGDLMFITAGVLARF